MDESIVLALTGASGAIYGLRLLQCLINAQKNVHLLFSQAAHMVIATETDLKLPSRPADIVRFLSEKYTASANQLSVYGKEQWSSPLASGTHLAKAMVICPCSAGSLAAIAHGASNNLVERAADVMIKEKRHLILVPRETPLSSIHLENMLKLSNMGVTLLPANPGFYHKPSTINDLVDFLVARILDHLHIQHELIPRWGYE